MRRCDDSIRWLLQWGYRGIVVRIFPQQPRSKGQRELPGRQKALQLRLGFLQERNTFAPQINTWAIYSLLPTWNCRWIQCDVIVRVSLFLRRFNPPPSVIVYDNACKLHAYVLNREPARFAKTRFYVDRLHFRKGHTGCTLGYSLDTYKTDRELKTLNSQANEQANSGLRRIQIQLAYMKPDNFMHHTSLFLALKNMDKKFQMKPKK